jgi:hypothetical protein
MLSRKASRLPKQINSIKFPGWINHLHFKACRLSDSVCLLGFFFSIGITPFDSQEKPCVVPEYMRDNRRTAGTCIPGRKSCAGSGGRIVRAVQRGKINFLKSDNAECEGWFHTDSLSKGKRSLRDRLAFCSGLHHLTVNKTLEFKES